MIHAHALLSEFVDTCEITSSKRFLSSFAWLSVLTLFQLTLHEYRYGKNGDLAVPFWSTKDAGQQPFTFNIGRGQVIKCWDEGVLTMKIGEKAKLTCTPDYGYVISVSEALIV